MANLKFTNNSNTGKSIPRRNKEEWFEGKHDQENPLTFSIIQNNWPMNQIHVSTYRLKLKNNDSTKSVFNLRSYPTAFSITLILLTLKHLDYIIYTRQSLRVNENNRISNDYKTSETI